jgi:hypothetical protein
VVVVVAPSVIVVEEEVAAAPSAVVVVEARFPRCMPGIPEGPPPEKLGGPSAGLRVWVPATVVVLLLEVD